MNRVFDPDNFFWKCFDKMGDVLGLSLLWSFLSLPVFTMGAATTALYDAASRSVRGEGKDVYSRFFHTFKSSFKLSTLCTLVFGGALVLLAAGFQILSGLAQERRGLLVPAMAYYVLCACLLGYLCWLFPLLSRYEYGFQDLCRTTLQFWFAHFPSTLIMAALLLAGVELTARLLFPLCFLPACLALVDSLFIERAFRKHTPAPAEEPEDPELESSDPQ